MAASVAGGNPDSAACVTNVCLRPEQYLDSCGISKDAVLSILAQISKQERIRLSERKLAGQAQVPALVRNEYSRFELRRNCAMLGSRRCILSTTWRTSI